MALRKAKGAAAAAAAPAFEFPPQLLGVFRSRTNGEDIARSWCDVVHALAKRRAVHSCASKPPPSLSCSIPCCWLYSASRRLLRPSFLLRSSQSPSSQNSVSPLAETRFASSRLGDNVCPYHSLWYRPFARTNHLCHTMVCSLSFWSAPQSLCGIDPRGLTGRAERRGMGARALKTPCWRVLTRTNLSEVHYHQSGWMRRTRLLNSWSR